MNTYKKIVTLLTLALLLLGLVACGGTPEPTPPPAKQEEPTTEQKEPAPADEKPSEEKGAEEAPAASGGDKELVDKMHEAMNGLQQAVLTAEFQVATATDEGPVKGTVKLWKEEPNKMRAEFQSDREDVNGLVAVSDGDQGWAYSSYENVVVVSSKSQYRAQLRNQPELRVILEFSEELLDRGFSDTQVENQGTENINGRDTQKVRVQYNESPDAKIDLSGVVATYWIDPITNLPHRVDVTIDMDGAAISGRLLVQGDIVTDQPIDAAIFTFDIPAEAKVIDLSKLPALPGLSNEDVPDLSQSK
jgi:outer membrane lipoprotein-sorting protein